jgi:hypothetical protein
LKSVESRKQYLERLKQAVEQNHKCSARYCTTIRVTELHLDKVLWQGDVEVFDLKGHPDATRCYGWSQAPGKKNDKLVTVLETPPIDSAESAVRAALRGKVAGR